MFKNEREEKSLVEWESIITDSYLSRKNQALSDSDSSKINSTFERYVKLELLKGLHVVQ